MRNLAFSTFIYSLLYGAFGVLWAINTHDSNFDFSVFQMYRIVFNNLNFPHVTAWNPMTHPGNAEELHLYSTMFAPAYSWFMTIWSQWFGFSIESIRIGGVFIYFPIALIGTLSLCQRCGGNPLLFGSLFFLAPLWVSHSISCDWIFFSLGFLCCGISEWLKAKPSLRLLFVWMFLAVFFQFLNAIVLALFFLVSGVWQNFKFKSVWITWRFGLISGGAALLALTLSLFFYEMADDRIMSFYQYIFNRGGQAVLEPQSSTFYFFTLERVWGQFSYNFPLFIIFFMAVGGVFFSPHSKERQCLLTLALTHFIYCSVLMGTSAAHYFYTFFYLMITPAMVAHALKVHKKDLSLGEKSLVSMMLLVLVALGAYEFKKNGYWVKEDRPLDHFIESGMHQDDLLVRDTWYNTWPLNGTNPLNTVYLDPKEQGRKPFADIEHNIVYGYALTWNSAYHVRPRYQKWTRFQPEGEGDIYYLTQKWMPDANLVLKDTRHIIHEGTQTYYLYKF